MEKRLENTDVDCSFLEEGRDTILQADMEEELQLQLVVDVIIEFFKTRTILQSIKNRGFSDIAFCAFLGSMVGAEREEEEGRIKNAALPTKIINIAGVFDFSLAELRDNWNNLACLGEKLFAQCQNDEDVYALSTFMLGMNDVIGKTVAIFEDGMVVEPEKVWKSYSTYFEKENENVVFSILANAPSDVIIQEPRTLDEEVTYAIRRLGQK